MDIEDFRPSSFYIHDMYHFIPPLPLFLYHTFAQGYVVAGAYNWEKFVVAICIFCIFTSKVYELGVSSLIELLEHATLKSECSLGYPVIGPWPFGEYPWLRIYAGV